MRGQSWLCFCALGGVFHVYWTVLELQPFYQICRDFNIMAPKMTLECLPEVPLTLNPKP